jgi:hypothetical protein
MWPFNKLTNNRRNAVESVDKSALSEKTGGVLHTGNGYFFFHGTREYPSGTIILFDDLGRGIGKIPREKIRKVERFPGSKRIRILA